MSSFLKSLQKILRFIEKICPLFTIPKPNRVEKNDTFWATFESEPVFSIGLWVYYCHFFVLIGAAISIDQYPDFSQFVFDHRIDPFI